MNFDSVLRAHFYSEVDYASERAENVAVGIPYKTSTQTVVGISYKTSTQTVVGIPYKTSTQTLPRNVLVLSKGHLCTN